MNRSTPTESIRSFLRFLGMQRQLGSDVVGSFGLSDSMDQLGEKLGDTEFFDCLYMLEVMKSLPPHSMKKTIFAQRAFSMIELLVVMAIMALLLGSSVVGLSSYQGQAFTKQAYDLREILASAKTTAMAKNTFVWVGFGSSTANGQKSLLVTAFSSRSGLNDASASNLNSLMRPCNFQNFSLDKIGTMTGGPEQTGVDLSSTPSNWQLPAQKVDGTAVSLTQVILFSPTGQCFLTANPLAYIDIGVRPSRAGANNDNNKAALQVSGLTSQVQLFRE